MRNVHPGGPEYRVLKVLKKWKVASAHRPKGITALSVFFSAGAAISFAASLSLALPNSFLASMWRLNPRAHEGLLRLGLWAVALMSTVSLFCAAAAIGLWRGSRWGYWLAVGLIAINLIGDIANVTARHRARSDRRSAHRGSNTSVSIA